MARRCSLPNESSVATVTLLSFPFLEGTIHIWLQFTFHRPAPIQQIAVHISSPRTHSTNKSCRQTTKVMQAKCELFKNEVEDGVGWLEDSGFAAQWFVSWGCHTHPEARVTSHSSM